MNLGTAARQSTFESKYSAKTANTKDSVAKQKSNEAQRYWRSLIATIISLESSIFKRRR